jgi:hypothetical protein
MNWRTVMNFLDKMLDELAAEQFGMTLTEAREKRVCISCKESIYNEDGITSNDKLFFTPQGVREWTISAMCEKCFDEAFKDE